MKIIKYYIDKAVYKALDEEGTNYVLKVDYWNNNYSLDIGNEDLENFAKKLLQRKHRKNLAHKMLE